MFIDEVILTLRAGKGGDGIVSWRREKYIPKGGPYGGNGGNGGNIILRATTHDNTLSKFRHMRIVEAKNGEKGGTQVMHGASADDLILEVPVGTLVTDAEDSEILCDLVDSDQEFLICQGGRGGYGNAHFPSSTRQAPNFAELGDTGEERTVKMELKLVADVGLVGLPNAGKSTLIRSLTNVRPKIADYAFTTLVPNLGVMEWKNRSLVIEDVPGLIEGASDGRGLGFQFLKHIDRCHTLIHLLDATVGADALIVNYRSIRHELENWSENIRDKEELIIFSKIDLIDPEHLEEIRATFEDRTKKKVMIMISAGAYMHIDELKDILIKKIPEKVEKSPDASATVMRVYDLKKQRDPKRWSLERLENGDFRIHGERIEEIARMTDTRYTDGVNRVYDVMEKLAIMRKIKQILSDELISGSSAGFFEGEDDYAIPDVWIADKSFSLEGIIFQKGS